MLLQQFLNMKGHFIAMDGSFGPITQSAVIAYQKASGVPVNGIVQQDMISLIQAPCRIDSWCHAIQDEEGYIAPCAQYPTGTPAWRNKNPGNLEFANQLNAVADGRFACFRTYSDGYNALRSMLIRMCTGQMSLYSPSMTLLQVCEVYAPSSDGNDPVQYSDSVGKFMGVDPKSAPISSFLP